MIHTSWGQEGTCRGRAGWGGDEVMGFSDFWCELSFHTKVGGLGLGVGGADSGQMRGDHIPAEVLRCWTSRKPSATPGQPCHPAQSLTGPWCSPLEWA